MESIDPDPSPRRSRLILGVLLAVGFGLRLWYWLSIRHSLLFTVPFLDGQRLVRRAQKLFVTS